MTFEDVYREHHRPVLRWLAWRFGERIAEDAVQETFLQAWKAWDRVESIDNMRRWLIGTAKHVAGHMLRAAGTLSRGGDVVMVEWSGEADMRATEAPQGMALYVEQLRGHFGCLGPAQQEALNALADGDTLQEFAERTGRSQQAVSGAANLGRRRLREKLKDDSPFMAA